jgi:hypothetical protein
MKVLIFLSVLVCSLVVRAQEEAPNTPRIEDGVVEGDVGEETGICPFMTNDIMTLVDFSVEEGPKEEVQKEEQEGQKKENESFLTYLREMGFYCLKELNRTLVYMIEQEDALLSVYDPYSYPILSPVEAKEAKEE